ncbi:LytR/AlgR family response regulator transcription factor [Chitinophaga solisilvae]|uniref:Uncharacterized protein n=1 Tax=Chitinophaga solisilvae TaxID=1233460 RepID=A0A433WBF9_9BACT|nr:LytTR family DNA-binding domain-containing protein [Chitinophaga solisilvae]NSL90108.1 hypothetical protein [Chitinophaga solisilvae]
MMLNCMMLGTTPHGFEALENYLEDVPFAALSHRCNSLKEANTLLQSAQVQVVFLGRHLDEMKSPPFAALEPVNKLPLLVLSYPGDAAFPFVIHAIEVLSLPFTFNSLYESLQKIFNLINMEDHTITQPEQSGAHFILRCDNRHEKIAYNDLRYVEVMDDHILLHLHDQHIATTETLEWIMSRLPVSEFMRVHRWFVVALRHVTHIGEDHIQVGPARIPVTPQAGMVLAARLREQGEF